MQVIAQYFAVGVYATRIPNAPRVNQSQAELLLAIPDRPSRDCNVEYFLANSPQELKYVSHSSSMYVVGGQCGSMAC